MFFVYIIYSIQHNKIYIGQSGDPEARLRAHNNPEAKKGYTKRYRPWTLIYKEEVSNRSEALKREKQLKSGNGRAFAWRMVEKFKDNSQ